jgi:hypothetical protein
MAEPVRLNWRQIAVGGAVAVAAALLWAGMRQAGGAPQPAFTEDLMPPLEPHLAQPADLTAAMFLQHRYPVSVGGEISAVIHRGWNSTRIDETDPMSNWAMFPPSEIGVLSSG